MFTPPWNNAPEKIIIFPRADLQKTSRLEVGLELWAADAAA
jgi:hypothetical protein